MFTAGIGKTQLGIQLAVDAHLPSHFHGIQVSLISSTARHLGSFFLVQHPDMTFFWCPCVNVVQGEAVYIDTEGSFMEERAKDIATAFVTHVKKMARSQQTSCPESPTKIDEAIGNFSVFRLR